MLRVLTLYLGKKKKFSKQKKNFKNNNKNFFFLPFFFFGIWFSSIDSVMKMWYIISFKEYI